MAHSIPVQPTDAASFQALTGADDATMARLVDLVELLKKWQPRINLVGPATLPHVWGRHILDSYQLLPHIRQPTGPLVDFGSGAGFPAMVLAAAGLPDVHLVESDSRKAAFLRESARILGVGATIHNCRIEAAPSFEAVTITARALAPLDKLLTYAEGFLGDSTQCLFLKGRDIEEELTQAHKIWMMNATQVPSQSDAEGTILLLTEVRRHDRDRNP